jgi:hypothetical protein
MREDRTITELLQTNQSDQTVSRERSSAMGLKGLLVEVHGWRRVTNQHLFGLPSTEVISRATVLVPYPVVSGQRLTQNQADYVLLVAGVKGSLPFR